MGNVHDIINAYRMKIKNRENAEKRANRMKKKITITVLLLVNMLLCVSCGMAGNGGLTAKESTDATAAPNTVNRTEQEEQSTADLPGKTDDYYMVVKHDIQNYQITLMDVADGQQICYEYTDGTEFFDKYGEYTPRQEFSEGKLAVIERMNSNDTLGALAFTDQTWDYENVRNYTIDPPNGRIDIADSAYQFDLNGRVFSEGEEKELSVIGDSDILNLYGVGHTVYAIVVETGHGTLALTNTDLFEGGWVNLGTKVYAKVTKDMTMELPEGVYDFSVANDGYGDSGEVRIRRDKVTMIDLNDYKGEGPKMCKVTFDVGVAGAVLTINGKKVNHKKPMELRYGVYRLGVYAQGYDAWTRQLVINSPKANIEILLTDDTGDSSASASDADSSADTEKDSSTKEQANSNSNTAASNQSTGSRGKAGSKAGSYTGSNSSGQTGSSNDASSALANAALGSSLANIITGGDSTDYLDTLSDLVDSLDRLKGSSSNRSDDTDGN